MKGLQTHKKAGFTHTSLHTMREPHPIAFLKRRASFWIATLSLFTFVTGNMMGQHGWYGFWASVLGEEDNTAIAYTGTVLPFEKVVDYECWARFGGDWKVHTYRQAPADCLRDMPVYTSGHDADDIFSMQYMSSYTQSIEDTGTHGGVDIRVPVGTPVRATMNGRVISSGNQPQGFGQYIVLEHPDVPDPSNPESVITTLYTNYGHLGSRYVDVGQIVQAGEVIGLSGNSGNSTGPHLDFSVVREGAPFYPFYPRTKEEGYTYSVNPLVYVQQNYHMVTPTTVVASDYTNEVVAPSSDNISETSTDQDSITTIIAQLQSRREERLRERLALLEQTSAVALTTGVTTQVTNVAVAPPTTVVQSESVLSETRAGQVDGIEISHDGYFTGRGWEKVRIRLLDADGNTVTTPRLDTDLVLRTEFGDAEFRPSVLSPLDFFKGEATVNMLPRGRRTVVIKVMPYADISKPMQYE